MNKAGYVFSEICGWIANIVIFLPLFLALFVIKFFGLSNLLDKKPIEDLP